MLRARKDIMRFFGGFLSSAALSLLFLTTCPASADPPARILVVEITGDIEDPEALRAAIGDELHAAAVTPGDPRASSAVGTLRIDAHRDDKRMSATYRSVGLPVSRTVDMPTDPQRTRSVAVILAGNIARNEADELLNGRESPPPPDVGEGEPRPNGSPELVRLHGTLRELAKAEATRTHWIWIGLAAAGTVGAGAGLAQLGRSDGTRDAGDVLLVVGGATAALSVIGNMDSLLHREDYARMALDLERSAGVDGAAKAVGSVERRWADAARHARRVRTVEGGVLVGLAALLVATGATLDTVKSGDPTVTITPSSSGESRLRYASSGLDSAAAASLLLVIAGIGCASLGVERLVVPSPIEQSWTTYRMTKGAAPEKSASTLRPTASAAPAKGGGTLTFGLAF